MMKKKQGRRNRHRSRLGNETPLEIAIRLHKSGEFAKAEKSYRQALEVDPGNAQTRYLCGMVTSQLGREEEAIELLKQAITLQPDQLSALSELAKLLRRTGRLQESADTLRKLISLQPEMGELYNNLGVVLKQQGKADEAAIVCRQAVELSPESAESFANLGDILKQLDRLDEAVAAYRKAIVLDPGALEIYRNLAAVLRTKGQLDEATDVLKQWLSQDPDDPTAQHMLAAFSGKDAPVRASDDYVRNVFDEFAASFDNDLGNLDYQAPQLIDEAVKEEFGNDAGKLDILDAGCGTGLCGSFLRSTAQKLIGVDLSSEMILRAQELGLYDDLVVDELTHYLNENQGVFDLIVAADTFNYFGALEPLFLAAANAMRNGAVLIYSLEHCDDASTVKDYRLNENGRFSHNENYVKRCMANCGFEIFAMENATLRKERDQPVIGIVVSARKQ